jgi:hypothetical protein
VDAPEDTNLRALLASLVASEALFLVAGGIAVWAHGYVRHTADIDIIPRPDQENMTRIARLLAELDAAAIDQSGNQLPLDVSHPESLAVGNYFLTTRLGRLDLFNGPRPDLNRYTRLADASIEATIGGVTVRVIGKDDLIAMKREAGRPKDLEDIAALTELERRGENPA